MGFTPQQVNAMSMWQFYAAADAHQREDGRMSDTQADELFEWLKSKE